MTQYKLLIRHLPSIATADDIKELLSNFGAIQVHYFGHRGKMKNSAIAKFNNETAAKKALQCLHQLQVFDRKLVVVYATEKDNAKLNSNKQSASDTDSDDNKQSKTKYLEDQKARQLRQSLPPVAAKLGLNYPSPPDLHYLYPEANVMILTNIVNAMLAVPKFYNQVLHLMNRMNLPPPFAFPTPTPPMKSKLNQAMVYGEENLSLSTDESELESEDDTSLENNASKRKRLHSKTTNTRKQPKRPKIKLQSTLSAPKSESRNEKYKVLATVDEIFDGLNKGKQGISEFTLQDAIQSAYSRNLEEKLKPVEDAIDSKSNAGFGKFAPTVSVTEQISNLDEDMNDCIKLEDLRANRMSEMELQKLPLYQKYERKEPTSRLYIKNLSDKVKEQDLMYIFSRFINKDDSNHLDRFDIRLLTRGRMKGQAFINLPDETTATEAVNETHGYVLHNKPMIVDFAQSAKKKD